jgi:hypothetical protein
MPLNTTAATVATGQVATAALWNLEVRDAVNGIQSAWTAYTPTLTNITLGNGTLTGSAFMRVGKTIHARVNFIAGTTTTYAAGVLGFSLPVTPSTAYTGPGNYAVGAAWITATAATRASGTAIITTGGTLALLASTPANSTVTNLVPGTFTTTSIITLTVTYEAA